MPPDIHLLFRAEDRFLKFQIQVFAKIRPTLSPAAPPSALPKHVAKSKDVAKNVAKILKDRRIEPRRPAAAPAQPSMTKAVIQ
jgi:hypothetical protein